MHDWPETCESLILRVKNSQDAVAWDQFLATYRPVVHRLARNRGLQPADAEDLAQRIFMSVSTAVQNWEPRAGGPRFRNWLGKIVRNAIINTLTRAKPDRGSGSSSVHTRLHEEAANSGVSEALGIEGRIEAVRWAAREIEPEFTAATWAMFYETAIAGSKAVDVAKSFNRSVGAVYIARCRVMQRIKEKLAEISDIWSFEA